MQACSVTPGKPPFRFPDGRLWLAALVCGLALAGCAPDYGGYGDDVAERAGGRSKRHAAAHAAPAPSPNPTPNPVPPKVAAKPIPLPAQALLTPQRKPDCESDMPDAQRLVSVAPPQPDPNAELALRIKLDYERECYRQAEQRVRERLQKLQASTGETIKAVKEREQAAR